MAENPFAVNLFDMPPAVYDHGIPADKVDEIKQLHEALEKRVKNGGEPMSLEEFAQVQIPWLRIHRTEVFILNPEKPKKVAKEKVPKEPKALRASKASKEVKEKALTKKQIAAKLSEIIMKMAMGQALSEEDQVFFDEQNNKPLV